MKRLITLALALAATFAISNHAQAGNKAYDNNGRVILVGESSRSVYRQPQARNGVSFSVQIGNGHAPRYSKQRHYQPRHYGQRKVYRHAGPRFQPQFQPRHQQRRHLIRAQNAHYAWCQGRYRSYHARSNTFQPHNGPRRACRSPYGG